MGTRGQWATDLLTAMGNTAPDSKTVNLVAAWTAGEGTKATYNPLATTLPATGATDYNFAGVKNYPSRDAGINATVLTLKGSFPGYSQIVKGLQMNDSEGALFGMKLSPWGTNFALVETLWRGEDVRGQALASESGFTPAGPHGPPAPPGTAPTPPGSPSPYDPNPVLKPYVPGYGDGSGGTVTAIDVQTWAKIAAGAALMILGVIVLIIAISQSDAAHHVEAAALKGALA